MQAMYTIKKEYDEKNVEELVEDELSEDAYDTMSPINSIDLLRFNDVLISDVFHRGPNSYIRPTIAPVIKDHNVKIVLVAESIVVAENLDTYGTIFRSMSDMRMVLDSEFDPGFASDDDMCTVDDDEGTHFGHDEEEYQNESSYDSTHEPFH